MSLGQKRDFRSHLTASQVMFKVKGHGSGPNFTWVKVEGHVGEAQPKGHDICRWAHVNVKLHFIFLAFTVVRGILKERQVSFKD